MKVFLIGGKHSGELTELIGYSITIDGEIYTLDYLSLNGEQIAVYVCKNCENPLRVFLDAISIWAE